MPPWAAPVWLRVGYSLVNTAVRTRGPASTAARIPAPPAPTMTTSYRCWEITARLSRNVRVKRQQHVGPQHQREHHRQREQGVQPEAGGILTAVVVDDGAQTVAAVQLRQPEQQQIPGLPERRVPALRNVVEIDAIDAVLPHQHHKEMPQCEKYKDDTGHSHEQPGVLLEVGHAGASAWGSRVVQRGRPGVAALPDRGDLPAAELKAGGANRKCPIMCIATISPAG